VVLLVLSTPPAGFHTRSPSKPCGRMANIYPITDSLGNRPFTGVTAIVTACLSVVPASAKKKGPYNFAFDTAQNTLTLSKSRVTFTVTCGSSVPYMSTFPERRMVPSSLKMW
jgi:hypothetical protein